MTPEHKKQFIFGIILACDVGNKPSFCPSDFGMSDIYDAIDGYCIIDGETQCEKCARQACEKFFEEHGL